jgi:hypothetical protein
LVSGLEGMTVEAWPVSGSKLERRR